MFLDHVLLRNSGTDDRREGIRPLVRQIYGPADTYKDGKPHRQTRHGTNGQFSVNNAKASGAVCTEFCYVPCNGHCMYCYTSDRWASRCSSRSSIKQTKRKAESDDFSSGPRAPELRRQVLLGPRRRQNFHQCHQDHPAVHRLDSGNMMMARHH